MDSNEIQQIAEDAARNIAHETGKNTDCTGLRELALSNWEIRFDVGDQSISFYQRIFPDDAPESVRSNMQKAVLERFRNTSPG